MSDITTVHIIETDASTYSAQIDVSGHRFAADEPLDYPGGGDTGPSPFDLLTAALAACTVMTIRWYAVQKNIPLDKAEANVTFDRKTATFTKEITLHGDGLTAEQREKLVEISARCPVHKVLTGDIQINTSGH